MDLLNGAGSVPFDPWRWRLLVAAALALTLTAAAGAEVATLRSETGAGAPILYQWFGGGLELAQNEYEVPAESRFEQSAAPDVRTASASAGEGARQ